MITDNNSPSKGGEKGVNTPNSSGDGDKTDTTIISTMGNATVWFYFVHSNTGAFWLFNISQIICPVNLYM